MTCAILCYRNPAKSVLNRFLAHFEEIKKTYNPLQVTDFKRFKWRPQGDSNPCYRRERAFYHNLINCFKKTLFLQRANLCLYFMNDWSDYVTGGMNDN